MRTKDFLVTALALFASLLGQAAPIAPCPTCPGGAPPPPRGLPIDENIYILFGLALLLAAYHLILLNKKQKTQSKV